MTRPISAVIRTAVSLGIVGAGVIGFYLMGTPEVPTQVPPPDPPPLVTTEPAVAHTGGISFEVDGVVVPYREIAIAAQVAGRVSFKSEQCRSGKTVRKGELLLQIEPNDYELEVRRLSEELEQADAMIRELAAEVTASDNQIKSMQQQLEIDIRMLKRSQELMTRRAASDTEVDGARKSELTTRNALQSMLDQKNLLTQRQGRMESAKSLVEANLERAKLDLRRTEIVSPIDGVVVTENVEQDGFVQSGGIMLVLQDTSRLDVTCKLYMRQMNWLWQSEPIEDESDSFDGGYDFPKAPATVIYELGGLHYAWDGTVDRYDGAGLDNQTRMVPCRVHVNDPTSVRIFEENGGSGQSLSLVNTRTEDGNLEPEGAPSLGQQIAAQGKEPMPPTLMTGMFVKVKIHASPPIPLVRLPQAAIQPGNKVWVVDDGVLRRRMVSIANSSADFVVAYQLAGGLQAGDLIVTSPVATPVDGMKVTTETDAEQSTVAARGGRGPGNGQSSLRPPNRVQQAGGRSQ